MVKYILLVVVVLCSIVAKAEDIDTAGLKKEAIEKINKFYTHLNGMANPINMDRGKTALQHNRENNKDAAWSMFFEPTERTVQVHNLSGDSTFTLNTYLEKIMALPYHSITFTSKAAQYVKLDNIGKPDAAGKIRLTATFYQIFEARTKEFHFKDRTKKTIELILTPEKFHDGSFKYYIELGDIYLAHDPK